jgi:multiple antibiotic resistance protein
LSFVVFVGFAWAGDGLFEDVFQQAVAAIGLALLAALTATVVIKRLHDVVRTRNERMVRRYVQIAGRVTALFTGSFAIDMILRGIESWLDFLGVTA